MGVAPPYKLLTLLQDFGSLERFSNSDMTQDHVLEACMS